MASVDSLSEDRPLAEVLEDFSVLYWTLVERCRDSRRSSDFASEVGRQIEGFLSECDDRGYVVYNLFEELSKDSGVPVEELERAYSSPSS